MAAKVPTIVFGLLLVCLAMFIFRQASRDTTPSVARVASATGSPSRLRRDVTSVATHYALGSYSIPPDSHRAATAYVTDCGKNWYKTTDQAMLRRCSTLKMFAVGDAEERRRTAVAALPTLTPEPTWVWDGTPLPTSPADSAKSEIGRDELSPINTRSDLRAAVDMWHIGAVSEVINSGDIFVYRLYLISYPNGELWTRLLEPAMTDELTNRVTHTWYCPQPIGDLTITNVTGINGIVTFQSTTGTTGTLNMATGAWQFTSPIITTTSVAATATISPMP